MKLFYHQVEVHSSFRKRNASSSPDGQKSVQDVSKKLKLSPKNPAEAPMVNETRKEAGESSAKGNHSYCGWNIQSYMTVLAYLNKYYKKVH